jgi:hypothetical protein
MHHHHPLSSPCVGFTSDVCRRPTPAHLDVAPNVVCAPPAGVPLSPLRPEHAPKECPEIHPRGRSQSHQAPHPRTLRPRAPAYMLRKTKWVGLVFQFWRNQTNPHIDGVIPFGLNPTLLVLKLNTLENGFYPTPSTLNGTHAYSFHQVHTTHENTLHFSRIQL